MNRFFRSDFLLPTILYLVLSTLYLLTIPTGESPDEPSHMQCIAQVTERGRIPIIEPLPKGTNWWDRERIISGLVCAHMPLYYLGTGATQRVIEKMTHTSAHYEFPPNNPEFPTRSSMMFLHPKDKLLPNASEPASLTVLRLESIILGLVSLAGTYLVTARLTDGDKFASALAASLVAGWPQFVFMSRAINNDTLATALAVAAFTILIAFRRPGRYVWASACSALATLSKLTMSFTALGVVAIFAIEWFFVGRKDHSKYVRPAVLSSVIFSGLTAMILLHPTLRSHLEWSQRTINSINPNALEPRYWLDVIVLTVKSGWGRFGWMGVPTPDWQVLSWWGLLAATSCVGVVSQVIGPKREIRIMLTLMGGAWVASILFSYIRINLNRFQPQFRYIFPVVPALAAYASIGFFALIGRRPRVKRCAAPALALLLFMANLWIIAAILLPTYR